MKTPGHLKGEALAFWKRHASALERSGMLTARDVEGFIIVCELWSLIRSTDPTESPGAGLRYISAIKQFTSLGKQYALLPKDRKKSALEQEPQLDDALQHLGK